MKRCSRFIDFQQWELNSCQRRAEVMCYESGPGVEWLIEKFELDLSLVARLGGHSQRRTRRGKERFPGMTIPYALTQLVETSAETRLGASARWSGTLHPR